MLSFYTYLPAKIFLLNIYRGHFSGKVFGLYRDCREKIGKWSFFRRTYTAFHHGGIKTE